MGLHDPAIAEEVAALDAVVADLIAFAEQQQLQVMAFSTYHMNEVDQPVHLNRIFREQGWLKVIHNATGELIDFGTSEVFAVADHQAAQIYVRDPLRITEVKSLLEKVDGVAQVWTREEQADAGVDHADAGELFVLAEKRAWFTYYYWLDDANAPDFARTIAIHAKPGYDPCELFLDPKLAAPKLKIAKALLRKKLGMRYLLDVIPLDARLVKGSHGLPPDNEEEQPAYVSSVADPSLPAVVPMTSLKQRMLDMIFS